MEYRCINQDYNCTKFKNGMMTCSEYYSYYINHENEQYHRLEINTNNICGKGKIYRFIPILDSSNNNPMSPC
jgi:hypothetical protein